MNWPQILGDVSGDPQIMLLLALPVLGAVVLLIFAFTDGNEGKQLKKRLGRIRNQAQRGSSQPRTVSVVRSSRDSDIAFVDNFIKRSLPKRDLLRRRLAGAGLNISLSTYLSICLGLSAAIFIGVMSTGFVPPPAAGLIAVAVGIGLPHMIVGFLAGYRRKKFIAHFPEAIDLMTRGLKSGLPIAESMKTASVEIPDPVGYELRQVVDAVRLGRKIEDVLWETADRIGIQEFRFFTISMSIQGETGGNLTETLANLADVLRRRRQLKLKVKALSSEAKASAIIIGSLPFVMAAMIYVINKGYIMKLVEDQRGLFMIGFGALSFLIGITVMVKMVRFDY